MPIRIPKMKSITACSGTPGTMSLIGLGDDNKTYFWSYDAASWVPNWNLNPAVVPVAAATAAAGVSPAAPPVAIKKKARG